MISSGASYYIKNKSLRNFLQNASSHSVVRRLYMKLEISKRGCRHSGSYGLLIASERRFIMGVTKQIRVPAS